MAQIVGGIGVPHAPTSSRCVADSRRTRRPHRLTAAPGVATVGAEEAARPPQRLQGSPDNATRPRIRLQISGNAHRHEVETLRLSTSITWIDRERVLLTAAVASRREPLCGRAFAATWDGPIDIEHTGQVLSGGSAEEQLLALLAITKTGANRADIPHRLTRFYTWWCTDANIPEPTRLATALDAWWAPDLGIPTPATIAPGSTARTPDQRRRPRGHSFLNLHNQRRRVPLACTRRPSRDTAA